MAKRKIETNIFELYFQLKINFKNALEGSEDAKLEEVGKSLIFEFEQYLKNASWTQNETVKRIINFSLHNLTASQIKEKLSLSESSYRIHIHRITERVYKNVFDGKPCPDGILYFYDLDAVKALVSKIRLLANPYNPYSELPVEVVKMIEKKINAISEDNALTREEISDAEYFTALNFIALLSNQVLKARLEKVSPDALKYVFNDLEKNESGESSVYLNLMFKPMSTPRLGVTESTIVQLKTEYKKVKGVE